MSSSEQAASSAAPKQQQQRQLDGSPITGDEARTSAQTNVRAQLFAHIRDRSQQGNYFLSVASSVENDVVEELRGKGFKVMCGKHATLIEWD